MNKNRDYIVKSNNQDIIRVRIDEDSKLKILWLNEQSIKSTSIDELCKANDYYLVSVDPEWDYEDDCYSSDGLCLNSYIGANELTGEITIPNLIDNRRVTSVGNRAFYECKRIEQVELGENIERLGDAAFCICNSLRRINFPSRLKEISSDCFNECGFKELIIPDTIKRIKRGAFVNNRELERIELPNGIQKIELMCFAGCKKLKSITIPESVRVIEDGVFSGCESLETVKFPAGIEKIGTMAFLSCRQLKSVELPAGVELGDMSFPENTEIHYLSRIPQP